MKSTPILPTAARCLGQRCVLRVVLFLALCGSYSAAQPISLHPENPHYFLYKGEPTVLITSAMHYGAVLNLDVDQDTYLKVLHQHGFNQHREFAEPSYSFRRPQQLDWSTRQTPLGPRPGRLLSPWARSDVPGYINGGNKFDLDRWDDAYFKGLKEFCHKAANSKVVIEMVLFTVLYSDDSWDYSPLNAKNNINGIGNGKYTDYNLIVEPALYEKQKALARKMAEELNDIDNVYFEICNEPYWAKGIPERDPAIKEQHFLPEVAEWQKGIAAAIAETEARLPKRHLIAENVANTYRKIEAACHPAVSIINFHYALPSAVADNYALNLPIAFDESTRGTEAPDRRVEAWLFMMAGGAVYSNLDFSFAIDDMTGRGRNPLGPRRSGLEVRNQLAFLKRFFGTLDFVHMKPLAPADIQGLSEDVEAYGLAKEGSVYAVYFHKRKKTDVGKVQLRVSGAATSYLLRWYDPALGSVMSEIDQHDVTGGVLTLNLPHFSDDLLLKVTPR